MGHPLKRSRKEWAQQKQAGTVLRLNSAPRRGWGRRGLRVEYLEYRLALSANAIAADAFNTWHIDETVTVPTLYEAGSQAGHAGHDDGSRIDSLGNIYIAEPVFDEDLIARPSTSEAVGAPPFPLGDTFLLHSNPTATKVIYLDFDGHTTTGTAWNQDFGATIVTPASGQTHEAKSRVWWIVRVRFA